MDFFDRIKKPIPQGMNITPGTTPVIYFGEYANAKACTISINPSDREFLNQNHELLVGKDARLCSRKSLSKNDSEPLNEYDAQKVVCFCDNYFKINPYKLWFAKYEEFLNYCGFSYYQGSVVHLDLVQWATTPFWSEIKNQKNKDLLLQGDLPFLKKLLEKNFDYIFLNGRTVMNEVQKHLGIMQVTIGKVVLNNKEIEICTGQYNTSRVHWLVSLFTILCNRWI